MNDQKSMYPKIKQEKLRRTTYKMGVFNEKRCKTLENITTLYPIVIFPEGTRYSTLNYHECLKFAKKNDYPISKYAQLPKSKGAFALTKSVVYHFTMVYLDKYGKIITGEICEFPSKTYIHVKKHTDMPKTESEYKSWLHSQFAKIDDIYDNFQPTNTIEMTINVQSYDYIIEQAYLFYKGVIVI